MLLFAASSLQRLTSPASGFRSVIWLELMDNVFRFTSPLALKDHLIGSLITINLSTSLTSQGA